MIIIPFTPFHLGPGGFFGLVLLKWVDFPTLIIASVIIDIEPIIVIVFDLSYPLHGLLHSFFGAFLVAFLLILTMKFLRGYFSPIMEVFKIKQEIKLKSISIGAYLGSFSHVLLDAPLYEEMNPFFRLLEILSGLIRVFYTYTFHSFVPTAFLVPY